jgi:hypothetical protein
MTNGTGDKLTGPGDSLSSDAAAIAGIFPGGSSLAAIFKLTPRGRKILLWIVVIVVVYPLFSLAAAMFIIRKSPEQVQKGIRSFILSSIGVDEQIGVVDEQMVQNLNLSNRVIDAAIPLRFSTEGSEDSYQKVAARQKIIFEAYLRPSALIKADEDCAVPQNLPQSTLGTLTVRSLESRYQFTAPIEPRLNQLFAIGTIDDKEWKKFEDESTTGEPPSQHPLKITFTVAPELAGTSYLKCNKVDVVVYMNIFKRTMVRGAK